MEDRPAIDTRDREADGFALLSGGKHIKQRQIMIRGRNRERGILPKSVVIDQWLEVAGKDHPLCCRLEADRPVVRITRMPTPSVGVEIVHKVARCRRSARFHL